MGKTTGWALAVVAVMAGAGAGWAHAAPPWETLLSFNRVDADPQKPYQLAEENGPWLIVAATFSGDGAEQQAHELVLELRKRYKLPAYAHHMQFDFGTRRRRPGRQRNSASRSNGDSSGARNSRKSPCWWATTRASTTPRPSGPCNA